MSYLITDPKYYTDKIDTFEKKLSSVLDMHKIDMICFRDKTSPNTKELAKIFYNTAKQHNIKQILINNNLDLAIKYNFTGIHLNSNQFDMIKLAKQNNLWTTISTHDTNEVQKAYDLGVDSITYSPIFYTPFKGKPKGVDSLKSIVTKYQKDNFKIIGLGGILTDKQILQIKNTKADGFASIRYFA